MTNNDKNGLGSWRKITDGGSVVNIADLIDELHKAFVTDKNAGVQLTGRNALQGKLKNVVTAGVRAQLDNIPCAEVTVIARKGNTGSIFVGGADVANNMFGVELKANESFTFAVNNANLIYIDASVSGEGVSYVAI